MSTPHLSNMYNVYASTAGVTYTPFVFCISMRWCHLYRFYHECVWKWCCWQLNESCSLFIYLLMYRVFHKSGPSFAKSLLAFTIVPNLAHMIIHLSSKLCVLQNVIIFNINNVAIPHTEHTTDMIYIEIMLRLMKIIWKNLDSTNWLEQCHDFIVFKLKAHRLQFILKNKK